MAHTSVENRISPAAPAPFCETESFHASGTLTRGQFRVLDVPVRAGCAVQVQARLNGGALLYAYDAAGRMLCRLRRLANETGLGVWLAPEHADFYHLVLVHDDVRPVDFLLTA